MTEPTPSEPAAGAEGGRSARTRWAIRAGWLALALVVVAFLVQGANRPADPTFADDGAVAGTGDSTPATSGSRQPIEGFDEVAFRITDAEGDEHDWCAMLADTPATQAQGLMDQPDLRGYEGMLFRFEQPVSSEFYMRNTLIPLSIAFFDADGRFVSSADMEPCPDDVAECPLHGADEPYVHALEVPRGDLDELGIGPGSTLSFPGGGCGEVG